MAKKKSDKKININIGGDAQGTTIIVGDSNVVGQGTQKSTDIKSRFLVPFPHNPDFVGRDEELSRLHEMLQQKQSIVGIRPTVLVGLGGIGKTQLAVEYAHAYRDDYPNGVFWLNAINPLLIEFSDLAEKLEMSDRDTPRDKAARKAWDYLDSHPDALVIFDNVLEPSELNLPFSPDLVPANLRCRTLFTTRQRDFPRTFQPFEVKVLPEMAAMKLLLRSRPEVLEEHHPEWGWARIICAYLGWLPLALELASAYLGTYPEVSITGYLERLRTEGSLETVDESEVRAVDLPTRVEEILKAAAAGNLELKHQVAVSATLQTQWNRLSDEDAKLLFRAAGQFPEASWIPIPRLGLLTGIDSEAKAGRPSPLNVALKKLHAVSLIEELSDDRLRLHPLVQEFAARLLHTPTSFRLEMAKRVAAEFDDLIRLQARVIHYGVDMALEDLRTALGFCINQKESGTYSRIFKMERVLGKQAHNLRNWNEEKEPLLFLQQIRNEAFDQALKQWQTQAEVELVHSVKSYLFESFPGHSDPAELCTLAGHSKGVSCVALSADGRIAISASYDKTLKVWDVGTGRELRTLTGHREEVDGVAISADGGLAISASFDKTLKVWDVTTGRELRTLTGHRQGVNKVALSADGQLAVSASHDKTLKVWDVATGSELFTLRGHSDSVIGVAMHADKRLVVSSSLDNTVKMWDISRVRSSDKVEPREQRTIQEKIHVKDTAVCVDSRRIIFASSDGTLRVWDMDTGRELRTLTGHSDSVSDVAVSADGRLVFSGSYDNTLKVWDMETGRELRTFTGHSAFVKGVAISADGRLAVSGSYDNTIKVWDISSALALSDANGYADMPMERELRAPTQHRGGINGVALSADGRLALSASRDQTIKVWDVQTGCAVTTLNGHSQSVTAVALSADGRVAISGSNDRTLKVWDIQTGRELRTLTGHSDFVKSVAMSADGRIAASLVTGGVIIWELETGRKHRLIKAYSKVDCIALSVDGRLAISASGQTIKVWDVRTRRKLCSITVDGRFADHLALSADRRVAVSASNDGTLKMWDIPSVLNAKPTTESRQRTFAGHRDIVEGIVLNADGRMAISVSKDKSIKVWDLAAGRYIASFLADANLSCCAISADGKTFVAGDPRGRVHFLEFVGADEFQLPEVELIEKSWLTLNESQSPHESESSSKQGIKKVHSSWLPHWLKGLFEWWG